MTIEATTSGKTGIGGEWSYLLLLADVASIFERFKCVGRGDEVYIYSSYSTPWTGYGTDDSYARTALVVSLTR